MFTPQQLRDFLAQFRRGMGRYWRWSLAAFFGVLVLTGAGLVVMPRNYLSEARLYVKFGRDLNVDPTATAGGPMVAINESRENELNSLLEVLRSRAVLDKLVDTLGPDFILSGRSRVAKDKAPVETTAQRLADPRAVQPSASHRQAVAALEKALEIWVPRKSNVIGVSYEAPSPEQAQQIVTKLVEIYLDEHVRVHHTAGSYEFFKEQTALSKKQWQQASARLNEAKNRLGIVTLEGRRGQLQGEITDLDVKLLANATDLQSCVTKIASLRELIAGLPERIITQEAQAQNMAFDNMRNTLFTLESKEQDLAARMNETHPQLVAVRQQVADLRVVLSEQKPQRIQATQAINPARQTLEQNLLQEQSQCQALRGRGESLTAQRKQLQVDLEKLNANETAIAQMQQEVNQAETRHYAYAEKLEQSRINRSLDEERISSLSLVQPASFATKPNGPRKLYVLGCGLLLAMLAALAIPLAGMWLNPVLATADELAGLLELPLVGWIPPHTTTAAAA